MPMYNIKFRREVVSIDEYEETIEASSPEEAQAKADALAEEFNDSCPDGTVEVSAECRDWKVEDVAVSAGEPVAQEA